MKTLNVFAVPTLVAILALLVPAVALGHDGDESQTDDDNGQEVHYDRLGAQHDQAHENLREAHSTLHDRLAASDLEPSQQRRIHNAIHDKLEDRHDNVHHRLRRIRAAGHDRVTDRGGSAPGRRVGPPNRVPPQRRMSEQPGRRVGPVLTRGRSARPHRIVTRQARNR